MHKDWCGRVCAECVHPCGLDESIPCSPDCPNLLPNGEPDPEMCKGCEVYEEVKIMMDVPDDEMKEEK